MRRIALLVAFILLFVVIGSVITRPLVKLPVPPKAPAIDPALAFATETERAGAVPVYDPNVHALSVAEEAATRALFETILGYVDEETRRGCGDKESSHYFPQHPYLALTYKGGGFMPEVWLEFREMTRRNAPAMTLVPYNEVTDETYLVDIVAIQPTEPVATATYRHSAFSFGSEFESQPIFGGPGRIGNPSFTRPLKMSQAVFSLEYEKRSDESNWAWAWTILLGKGNFVRDQEKRGRKIKDNPEVLRSIADGIKKYELSLAPDDRMRPVDYDNLVKGVSAWNYGVLDNKPDVVVATLDQMWPEGTIAFAGYYRTYLLEKKSDGWHVLDMDTTSFTDYLSMGWYCKEP